MNKKFIISSCLMLSLSACVTIPQSLKGDYQQKPIMESSVNTQGRWGGVIVGVKRINLQKQKGSPSSDKQPINCLQISARPLDAQARPKNLNELTQSQEAEMRGYASRFLACSSHFLDPQWYEKNKEVTVTGKIIEDVEVSVNGFGLKEPVVETDHIYLWPPRPVRIYIEHPYPYWGPWGYPYNGWFGDPFWMSPPRRIHYYPAHPIHEPIKKKDKE